VLTKFARLGGREVPLSVLRRVAVRAYASLNYGGFPLFLTDPTDGEMLAVVEALEEIGVIGKARPVGDRQRYVVTNEIRLKSLLQVLSILADQPDGVVYNVV
jgi:hypothetical protein